MNSFGLLPGSHAADQPAEAICKGLDSLTQTVARLQSEIEDLRRLKNLSMIHYLPHEMDLEKLRQIQKTMKARLDYLNGAPAAGNSVAGVGFLARAETKWSVASNDPYYRQSTVRLRYSLSTEAILCTIKFNSDGSMFSFTDGKTVYLVNQVDGVIVGTSAIPRAPRAQGEQLSRAICFSPDSKFLAAAGPSNTTVIIEVATRKVVKTLEVHRNLVSTIAFFKDGRRFLTGGFDGKLCLWSLPDFQLIKTIQHGSEPQKEEMIAAIAIGVDDEYVAVGFMNGSVGLYDPAFSQPMTSFQAHTEFLLNVVISKDDLIATASHDRTAKLWLVRGVSSCRQTLTGHNDCVLAIAFSPKDPVLFTGSKDETIKCWHQKTGDNLFTLTGHRNTLFQIDHHPTERTIVSCSGDGLVCVWDYSLPWG
jgi:WD40 repeat protein